MHLAHLLPFEGQGAIPFWVRNKLDGRSITDLPLNGRDALRLAATTSNVTVGPKSDFTGIPPGEDFIGAATREITNSLTLDGIMKFVF